MSARLFLGAISTNGPKSRQANRTFDKCQGKLRIESSSNRMQSASSLPRPRRPPRPPPVRMLANLWLIQQVLMVTVAVASGQLYGLSPIQRRSTDFEAQQAPRGAQSSGCQAQTMGRLAHQLQEDGQQQQQQNQSAPLDQANSKKLFCFYDIQDDFRPQDLNPCLCTHVVYSYVAVRRNLSFIAGKKGDLRSLASLKRKNSHLKLLVSLRPDDFFSFDSLQTNPFGINQHQQAAPLSNLPTEQTDGGGDQTATTNSTLLTGLDELRRQTNSSGLQITTTGVVMNEMHQKFAKRIRDFIVRHSLDGINLDWPYFAQVMASGSPKLSPNETREHLTLILQALNENFQLSWSQSSPSAAYLRQQAPIVTLTVSKDFYSLVDGYNFHQINSLVDFVHLPAFDFDLNVDQYSIGHPARLHGIYDAENLDTLVDLLLSSGLPSDQLIAGIPTHGVQITSKPAASVEMETNKTSANNNNNNNNNNNSANLSDQLEAAANISIVSHSEVCRVRDLAKQNCSAIKQTNTDQQQQQPAATCWTMSRSRDLTAPFAYDSEHWIGFDDETSVKLKAKYALLRHLAGVAMFTVNNDDPTGQCGFGPYPLLTTVNGVLARAPSSPATSGGGGGLLRHHHKSANGQRGSFTRAPNQLLTATSLVSQIFSSSSRSGRTSAPISQHDLMSSASDEMPANHRADQFASAADTSQQQQQQPLMSFVDIIEKYGAVNRLDPDGRAHSSSSGQANNDQDQDDGDRLLACDKVGYQRYPRDCSRFYRCVQTPPQANVNTATSKPLGGATRQQPELELVRDSTNTSNAQGAPTMNQNHATTSITRLQYECPSGLVFDEQYQICNWPSWSAQCTGSGEVNSITSTKFVCPNYGYFQNQENCEYFYYCSDYNRGAQTQAYQFRCPFELGFDEEKLQCNWKWLVKGCSVKQPPPPGDATSTMSPNTAMGSQNETNFELAKKYLSTLESSTTTTTTTTTTLAPAKSESSPPNGAVAADQSNATTTLKPIDNVPTNPTANPTDFEPSRTTNVSSTTPVPSEQVQQMSRRSLELAADESSELPVGAEARAFVPALASHMTSLMASIEAIRQHRLKKANGNGAGQGPKSNRFKAQISSAKTKSETTTSASVVESKPIRYPSFVGTFPQRASSSPDVSGQGQGDQSQKQTTFRRRQTNTGSERPKQTTTSSESDKTSSSSASSPYKRRPPPASIFPFLPNSAVYMVADSLRSYGEAISDELNRYLRIAGDRMRDVLGHRPAKATSSSTTRPKRRQQQVSSSSSSSSSSSLRRDESDQFKVSRLAQLARRLTRNQSNGQRRLSLNDVDRRLDGNHNHQQLRRVRRDIVSVSGGSEQVDGDLDALESGSAPVVEHGRQYQRVYQQMAPQAPPTNIYHHQDALGRPPGYPLNPLDDEAKRAVLGPEPKLFHQPQALLLNQLSGISQQDYERLIRGNSGDQLARRPQLGVYNNQQQQWSLESGDETMLMAASEQMPATVAFAAPSSSQTQQRIQQQQQQQQQQPFGMPTIIRPIQSELPPTQMMQANEFATTKSNIGKQRRRSTVAMKLAASLSLPKLTSLMPQTGGGASSTTTTTTSLPPTTANQNEHQVASKGYMSFLPSFTDVVAPARNIMNKAMGPFNRAVQELISTLSPSSSKQPRPTPPIRMPTTPMPATTVQQQQQQLGNQPAHFRPMIMQQQQQQQPQQQPHLPNAPRPQQPVNRNRTSGPLLLTEDEARALSAQLDQLSKEQLEVLSNEMFKQQPKQQQQVATATASGQESPDYVVRLLKMLIQTSQNPEDTKLLDQLANSVNNQKPSGSDQSLIEIGQSDDLALLEALGMIPAQRRPSPEQDNQPEASYSNYQHQHQQQLGREHMKPGAMRPLLPQHQMNYHQNEEQQQQRHMLRPATNHPQLEIATGYDTTTKLVPVTLDYERPTQSPMNEQHYGHQRQQAYYNAPYYTATTTTTTTPQPTELVSRLVQEQSLERVVPPVKQTYSEIIENNVTTPDGIETTVESRTKTAISSGASFDISSQLGLGMVPGAFGGSLPEDSPLSQQQQRAALEQQQQQQRLVNATNSTLDSSNGLSNSTGGVSTTSQVKISKNGTKTTSTKVSTSKTSSPLKGSLNLQQFSRQQVATGATGGAEGNFLSQQQQQTLPAMSGERISTTSTTDQLLQDGAQRPLTSRLVTSSFTNARSQPNSVPATLRGYNFATQPVNQYEEVVIKKKFKPFPKTMIVPQESSFTVEEVRAMPTAVEQVDFTRQQQQQQQLQQQQLLQQQQQQFESNLNSASGTNAASGANLASGSFGSSNLASNSAAVTSQEQIKEDDFSTIASTFGEQPPASPPTPAGGEMDFESGSNSETGGLERESLTSRELRQRQVAKDLLSIGQQLQAQEEAAGQLGDFDSPRGLVENVNLSDSVDRPTKRPKSRRSKNKSTTSTTTTTTTTTTPAPEATTSTPIESSTAKRSVNQEEGASESSGNPRDRVEKAFTNFMVELKRTRKSSGKNGTTTAPTTTTTTTTTTTSTTTTTTTTRKPQTGGDPKRKSRSKKQKQKSNDLESSSSARRRQRTKQQVGQETMRRIVDQNEQVAVYGTKSGFMPIIRPDDPNYSSQRQVYENSLGVNSDPLSFGASFTSSKHAKLPPTGQELHRPSSEATNKLQRTAIAASNLSNRQRKQTNGGGNNNNSWRQYFARRLSDQISVVHLGNCSERLNGGQQQQQQKVIQVKLVILPASPNNQLVSQKNWQYLAANYPQLFPRDLQELNVETIDLGKTSISLSNGGLIDEHAEQQRHSEFRARYEPVSQLIEPRTFKALDEIIQRSSGQMFMVQRKDSLDRTIIAVIPDRPFIRTAMSPGGGYQRLVVPLSASSTTTTTAATPPIERTKQLNKLKASNKISTQTPPSTSQPLDQLSQSPQKAATFSRAIQESIQEAIKQHYDTVKNQLRQSLTATTTTTTTTDSSPQAWSTPAPETLAHMESMVQVHHQAPPVAVTMQTAATSSPDPMEAAGSSTEYSVLSSASSGYSQQAVFEVEGAEPKTLYGLDLMPSSSPKTTPNTTEDDSAAAAAANQKQTSRQKSSRFISIGSHLIATPMKKIVDQAYVNHFYDHINGHQLAKSIGFDELVEEPTTSSNLTTTTTTTTTQQQPTQSNESQDETDHKEDSLVPESACTRTGLFQHPFACNKFYECFWDKQQAKFTLHMFECPIKLAFDDRITGCAMPIESSLCVNAS